MGLIIEDGTGLAEAESYISVADADSYCSKLGHAAWLAGLAEDKKETALRQATSYIDARYPFRGEKLTDDQALEWPRAGMPRPQKRILDATCELAVRALAGPLYVDVSGDPTVIEDTIGPMTTKYAVPPNGGQVRFALVDDMMKPLLRGQSGVIRLGRA